MEIYKKEDGFIVSLDFEKKEVGREIIKRLSEDKKIRAELSEFDGCFSASVKNVSGCAEIFFKKENLDFSPVTFLFEEKEAKKVLSFLKTANLLKNCSLYLYKKCYILEVVLRHDSPHLVRLGELARRVRLSNSHDFLRLFCKRLPL